MVHRALLFHVKLLQTFHVQAALFVRALCLIYGIHQVVRVFVIHRI